MRKIVIIILALVVALSALPVTFACYNGGWGKWHRFWRPNKPVYCCPTYCNVALIWVCAKDNEKTFEEPKEVGQTTAYINYCTKKQLVITIENAYPGYEGIVYFWVKNTGTCIIETTGITINSPDAEYIDVELSGPCQVGAIMYPCKCKWGKLVIGGIPQLPEAQDATFTFTIDIEFEQYTGCP